MSYTEHRRRLHTLLIVTSGLAALALVSAALGGCMGGTAQVTPTPTRTQAPPTARATTTPTPQPTPTPLPTATPTSTATPTPTPWPENVNPLTGEAVDDKTNLERVPVAIKISNWPGQYVRPQSGIDSADLIFEHYNEGWFATRWTAVFLGQSPERVGPIRSGRIIDLEIPAMYNAVFANSGFSNGVVALFRNSDLYPDYVVSDSLPETIQPRPFYRDYSRDVPLEHTMYTSPALVREWAAARGLEGRLAPHSMSFTAEPGPELEASGPADRISIPWNRLDAEWRYDEASEQYLRWTDGTAHIDALSGQQLSAANVVVLFVPQWNTDIIEEPHSGALSIRWALWNEDNPYRPAILLRDGQRYDGIWTREERNDPLTLTDAEGNTLPYKVGSTFFEVVPQGESAIDITVE